MHGQYTPAGLMCLSFLSLATCVSLGVPSCTAALPTAAVSVSSVVFSISSDQLLCGRETARFVCPCALFVLQNGFSATPGWDATTGLGTPVYPKLLAAIKAIDARRMAAIAAAGL